MKIRHFLYLATSIYFLMALNACEKEENEFLTSSHNSNKSHNMGQNCMECHKKGGGGEGWFIVAGTVYDSLMQNTFPNTTIELRTEPNGAGTLKYTIEGDAKGNFYTTDNIDFGSGLYTLIRSAQSVKFMNGPITTGQCNGCHGVTSDRIWIK